MTTDGDGSGPAPDDAFGALGNETRMGILRALGRAAEPLSFSTLQNEVGVRDSGQFNYHLGKLVGHFVGKTDDGYRLRQAGRRVVEAVLSGAVTDDPVLEPTRLDRPCKFCGAATVVSYREEWVTHACTACDGAVAAGATPPSVPPELEDGYLGGFALPPAGVQDRSAAEVLAAGQTWTMVEVLAIGDDLCPRCSAPVERSVRVCEDHDASGGLCETCGLRHAVMGGVRCTNCIHQIQAMLLLQFLSATPVLSFLTDHGCNPHDPTAALYRALANHEATVRSREPFEARFELTLDDERLALTVDDDLSVAAATRE